ncbi:MAG: hypothetical protein OXI43_13965 [Candidatus Poribacteria bacterium]|nr:hypothetical protein [Candidatus Poribacteria bacterium]
MKKKHLITLSCLLVLIAITIFVIHNAFTDNTDDTCRLNDVSLSEDTSTLVQQKTTSNVVKRIQAKRAKAAKDKKCRCCDKKK